MRERAARPAVRVRNVNVRLGDVQILQDVNLQLPTGKLTALIGPNGAGKSTLINVLLNRVPYDGEVDYPITTRKPQFGLVPQRLEFDRGMPMTVCEFLLLSHQRWPLWLGRHGAAIKTASEKLASVGAEHLLDRQLGKLSGGELQRVLLANALWPTPEVLLMDEPISGIDVAGEILFCDIIDQLRTKHNLTILLVVHDLTVVTQHAQHVVCLNKSVQCVGEPVEVITTENLQKVFGVHSGIYRHHDHGDHVHDHGSAHKI